MKSYLHATQIERRLLGPRPLLDLGDRRRQERRDLVRRGVLVLALLQLVLDHTQHLQHGLHGLERCQDRPQLWLRRVRASRGK